MVILIAGASHTGKTALAQKLLEKYHAPYLSIDHLKMGLIRSGNTDLTPMDDDKLTDYLWPILREMIKTAIENKQNLSVEGCYIPYDWAKDFAAEYLEQKRDSINCVVLESKGTENIPTSIAQLHKALKEHHIPTTIATLRQIYTDSIDDVFVEGKENIVIFNTENFNNIHALMPNLTQAAIRYNITLYSQYSWIDKNIVLPQIYTSAFGDAPIATEYYNQAFEQYFGHKLSSIHPRYDLLGYDLTKHFIELLQSSDTTLLSEDWIGVQSAIQYQPSSVHAGYENKKISVIRK